MLFPEGKSALVRLSDCIKLGVANALDTTSQLIQLHKQYATALRKIRRAGERAQAGEITHRQALEVLGRMEMQGEIPEEDLQKAVSLDVRLHSEVLSVILHVCFTLESYINSLGYHLLKEKDILRLGRNASPSTIDTFLNAIDRMSTLSKWQIVSRLKSNDGLDASQSPLQDLKILFRFRDDHVHDKVVPYNDRSRKRYNELLPDPVSGLLKLSHAIYACDCYWNIVSEVHALVGIPSREFHRHYNLGPWFDAAFEAEVRQKAAEHKKLIAGE